MKAIYFIFLNFRWSKELASNNLGSKFVTFFFRGIISLSFLCANSMCHFETKRVSTLILAKSGT